MTVSLSKILTYNTFPIIQNSYICMFRYEIFYIENLEIMGGGLYTVVSFSSTNSLLSSSNSSSWGMFTEMGSLLTLSLYITLKFLSFSSSYVSLSPSFIMYMSLFLNATLGGLSMWAIHRVLFSCLVGFPRSLFSGV